MFPDNLNPNTGSQLGFLAPLLEMFKKMFSGESKINRQIAGKPFAGSPTPRLGSWSDMIQDGTLNSALFENIPKPDPMMMSGPQTTPTPAETMPLTMQNRMPSSELPSMMIPRPQGYEGPLASPEEMHGIDERVKGYRQEMGLPPVPGINQAPMQPQRGGMISPQIPQQAYLMADLMGRLPPNVLKKLLYSKLPKRNIGIW